MSEHLDSSSQSTPFTSTRLWWCMTDGEIGGRARSSLIIYLRCRNRSSRGGTGSCTGTRGRWCWQHHIKYVLGLRFCKICALWKAVSGAAGWCGTEVQFLAGRVMHHLSVDLEKQLNVLYISSPYVTRDKKGTSATKENITYFPNSKRPKFHSTNNTNALVETKVV